MRRGRRKGNRKHLQAQRTVDGQSNAVLWEKSESAKMLGFWSSFLHAAKRKKKKEKKARKYDSEDETADQNVPSDLDEDPESPSNRKKKLKQE